MKVLMRQRLTNNVQKWYLFGLFEFSGGIDAIVTAV